MIDIGFRLDSSKDLEIKFRTVFAEGIPPVKDIGRVLRGWSSVNQQYKNKYTPGCIQEQYCSVSDIRHLLYHTYCSGSQMKKYVFAEEMFEKKLAAMFFDRNLYFFDLDNSSTA